MEVCDIDRRQGSRPSLRKRNAKWQILHYKFLHYKGLTNTDKRREVKGKEGKIYPFEGRIPKNSKER